MPSRRSLSWEVLEIWLFNSCKGWMMGISPMIRLIFRTQSKESWKNKNKAQQKWWSMFRIWKTNKKICKKNLRKNQPNLKGLRKGIRIWLPLNQPSWNNMRDFKNNWRDSKEFTWTNTETWTTYRTSSKNLTSFKSRK